MAEMRIGDKLTGRVEVAGVGMNVDFRITAIEDGYVKLEGPNGMQHEIPVAMLSPAEFSIGGNVIVDGLQPDPPEAISRVARASTMNVLPSPVAPPTSKSGVEDV